MRAKLKPSMRVAFATLLVFSMGLSAEAGFLTVDEYLFDPTDTPDISKLNASVNASLSGNILTIILTNNSALFTSGTSAGRLLTGVGFQLPTGVTITSYGALDPHLSSAAVTSGSSINFTGIDLNNEWGFRSVSSGAIGSGHFSDPAVLSYNTAVGTVTADIDQKFSASFPASVAGPNYGILSATETLSGFSLTPIQNSMTFTLALSGTVPGDLLAQLESGNVGVTFGSPVGGSSLTVVPEPSSLLLAGIGCFGMFGYGARRRKKQSESNIA